MKKSVLLFGILVMLLLTLVGCTASKGGGKESGAPGEAGDLIFYLTALEPKGGTSASQLTPPEVNPRSISEGYRFQDVGHAPAQPDRWEVATYIWSPGAMVAHQGDRITLKIFATNGDHHETVILDPDGNKVAFDTWITGASGTRLHHQTGATIFDAQRGRQTVVTFTVAKTGAYQVVCETHGPTMNALLLVLPR